ncbi:protein anoxia up-regulated isoform X13 [Agrilus planipennis]|uniref:Protein anoxia up-regulated isoform X13 n=1 Tax=Agrilus planipennis TaxID=224129 RepID=A0A1W4X9G4_AGRPL|nr:protein anoxia up-regulated isoform X13 [Agrilus planipennis]
MVYESDFYTTRRPYRTSPSLSTYTVSSPGRYYVVRDSPERTRRAEEQYSYSYSSKQERSSTSGDPYSSRPVTRSYTNSERVVRSSDGGPGSYSYSTERSSRNYGDGPGGYHSSYSSTTSGRLPGGTSYRHYSYRV